MSKKDVTAIESGAGFIGSLAFKLIKRARQAGVSDEAIHELAREGEVADAKIDQIVAVLFQKKEDVPMPNPLLDFLGTVEIPATTEKFVTKDKFVVNTGRKAKVKISYIGDNFRDKFIKKVEETIGKTTLRYAKLTQNSLDKPILDELDGQDKAETTLAEMFSLMEKQGNGEIGILLTNGYANIFYIRDAEGVLWAVHCRWRDGGWDVLARSVGSPNGWDAGRQLFSRNSSESQS